jgi:phenylalanyl-tRNA synthetase beta chain
VNISFDWLKSLAPGLSESPDKLAERLALLGAPIEEITPVAAGLEDVIIGRVKAVRGHPNADRLSLCEVDNGEEVVQVVCGAPVIDSGGFYPFAPAGITLPGGLELKRAKIRGEYSNGMLCSEKELGLGRDASGIMLLTGEVFPGQSLIEALGLDDVRMDVEVTPNRGDWLSHVGIAREVAPGGVAGVALAPVPGASPLDLEVKSREREVSHGGVTIRIDEPEQCYRFLGVIIRGVKVGPSPQWMAARLRAVGQQTINNVVDATNFVMLEMGSPMHAYDLGKLEGSSLIVRRATEGETMQTLDGLEHKFDSEMLLICDTVVPHDIAGIMGGMHSSVTSDTTDLLLECALFEPKSIRRTGRALGISTDASYRFERGVDPEGHLPAVKRVLEVILATAGGEVDGPILEVLPRPWEASALKLRPARVEQVLGVRFDDAELGALLTPLGFTVQNEGEKGGGGEGGGELSVIVPGFRSYDVTREIDLIEEVTRAHGYDRFPEDLAAARPTTVEDDPVLQLEDRLRTVLSGEGLFEATNPAFAPEHEGQVELSNPISMEESRLRSSLIPGLIRNVEYNFARGERDVRLFELGTVFHAAGAGEPPWEDLHVAFVITGRREPEHWSGSGEGVDFSDVKDLVETVLAESGWEGPAVRVPADGGSTEEGSAERNSAEDLVRGLLVPSTSVALAAGDGTPAGAAGRLRPERIDAPAWAGEVWAMELTLPAEPVPRATPAYRPLSPFPGVDRDLALLVSYDVPTSAVSDAISDAGGALLERVTVFDLYQGDGVEEGHRSLAFRLQLQAWDRTLTDKEVDRVVEKIVKRLREGLGVEQRL